MQTPSLRVAIAACLRDLHYSDPDIVSGNEDLEGEVVFSPHY